MRRWLLRVGIILVVLVLLSAVSLALVLRSLDSASVHSRVKTRVQSRLGLELDYGHVHVSLLTGAHVENLTILQPPQLQRLGFELLRVRELDLSWSPGQLLRGHLERLSARGIELTDVEDREGGSSLDAFASPPPVKKPKPTPWSQRAAKLLRTLPVSTVQLDEIRVNQAREMADGKVVRTRVEGLRVSVEASPERANVLLVSEALRVDRERAHAVMRARVSMEVTATEAKASALLELQEQTFVSTGALQKLLEVNATARFDTGRGLTAFAVGPGALADGAALLEAHGSWSDASVLSLESASLTAEVSRLLALVPADLELPGRARGTVRGHVHGLVLDAVPRWAPGGSGEVTLGLEDVVFGADRVRRLAATVKAVPDAEQKIDGTVVLDLEDAVHGSTRVGGLRASVALRALRVNLTTPLASTGALTLDAQVRGLEQRLAERKALRAAALSFHLDAPLHGKAPYTAHARLGIPAFGFWGNGKTFFEWPLTAELFLQNLLPDAVRPLQSRGDGRLTLALAEARATVSAHKPAGDAVELTVTSASPKLEFLRSVVGPQLAQALPWEKMSISGETHATVAKLGSSHPHLTEHTEVHLTHLAFRNLTAEALALTVSSEGDADRHHVEAQLALAQARAAGKALTPTHLEASVGFDRRRPSLAVKAAVKGVAELDLAAALSVSGPEHTLRYDLDAEAKKLAGVAALLGDESEVDLEKLTLSAHAHGHLRGLVASLSGVGIPRVAPDLLSRVTGEGVQELRLADLAYVSEETELDVSSLTLHTEMHGEGRKSTLGGFVQLEGLELTTADHHLALDHVRDEVSGTLDGPAEKQRWDLSQKLAVGTVRQDYAAGYALAGATLELALHRTGDHTLHVDTLRFDNPAAGTLLAVTGNVDIGGTPKRMSLRGELEQDLAHAWADAQLLAGSGKVGAVFRVDSPDLRVFRTESALRFEKLKLVSAANGISVEGLNGEIPVSADFITRGTQLELLRNSSTNPYWMLRFADQHPLLEHPSFISAQRIVTPLMTMTGVAGNLKVDQNIVSLNQLEVGVRGGRISGQCTVNLRGKDTKLLANVRATHVLSSHGEPFDGNASLAIALRQRTVDGRMQVLKIGRRHLMDLLDLQDPRHLDSAINRIRGAMTFGYPEEVRVVSEHGFANVRVTLGGLARFVQVGELRGIPVGPFVDRVMDRIFASARENARENRSEVQP